MPHEDIIGKHVHLVAKPENFTPPTNNPDDCECDGYKSGGKSRTLIANCPCCDGVQILVEELCDCDNPSYIKLQVALPLGSTLRIRRIQNVEEIK
jgi:hypothetical protein